MHSWRKSGNLPWYMLIPCKKSRVNLTLLHPDPVSFLTIVPSDSCIRSCFCWIRVEIMRKVDCQKQTSNYHVSHFWTMKSLVKKTGSLRRTPPVFAEPASSHGFSDFTRNNSKLKPQMIMEWRLVKIVSWFFYFGLSSARALAIPYCIYII